MTVDIKNIHFLRLFWIIIIVSFFCFFCAFMINPQGSQLNLFFLHMRNFWADATNVTGMIRDMNPYFSEAKGSYPPLSYLLFYPLMRLSPSPEIVYPYGSPYFLYYYQPIWTLLFVISIFICLILLYTTSVNQLTNFSVVDANMTGIALCLSYPMLYTIERGNILLLSVLTTAIFIYYYDSECKWKKECALLCLAIATGIKLSPAIFGVLLICYKDWKAVLRTVGYGVFFLIVPFFFFEGGIQNLTQFINNLKYISNDLIISSNIMGTGLLPSCLKYLDIFVEKHNGTYTITMNLYFIIEVIKYGVSLMLLWGVFQVQEKWQKVLNITIILLIFPRISFFYCTLYLIPFSAVFLNHMHDGKLSIGKIIIFICLIMIFFVYRCPISDYFNYNFAIPLLSFVACAYSNKAYFQKRTNQD